MARLPQPGSDSGTWGNVLNDYLSQAHKSNGTLKDNIVTDATIADGAITSSKIATDAVGASQIADGSITETLLAPAVQTKLNSASTPSSVVTDAPQLDVAVGLGANASTPTTTTTETGTARVPYLISVTSTDLRLVFINWHETGTGNTIGTDDLVISASIVHGGTIYRATFDGAVSVTVKPSGIVTSDPLALDVPAGTFVEVRTYVSGTWRPNRYANGPGMGGWTATTDLTAPGSAAISDNTSFRYLIGPAAILGTPVASVAQVKTVIGIGDSIMDGISDGPSGRAGVNTTYSLMGGGGFVARAARSAEFSYLNAGIGGQFAQIFGSQAGHYRTMTFARNIRTCVEEYGRNDLSSSRTLAQLQGDVITIWNLLAARGLRTFRTTLVPDTTSTDGWRTTTNQTVRAWETNRVNFNDWLRDGAPMVSGAAAAVGTSGAARCAYFDSTGTEITPASGPAHPLYAVTDIADAVESARNSGKWAAPTVSRTVSDGSITSGQSVLNSSTASFTTADIGRIAVFPGAGASGGVLVGTIKNVFSSTQASITPNASTTVSSGGTIHITELISSDGVHPSATGAAAVAGALPVGEFI